MEFRNFTPFPNLRFFGERTDGSQFGVLLVKGTFSIGDDGQLNVADEQARVLQTDTPYEDHNTSSLRFPSDIVPKKPNCDVIINAIARAPHGVAIPSWTCGVELLNGRVIRKELNVTGPREWLPMWRDRRGLHSHKPANDKALFVGWRLSEPTPVTSIPVRYELAYGGTIKREKHSQIFVDAYEYNPIGKGWYDPSTTSNSNPLPAPQITSANCKMQSPFTEIAVEGLGAIPPAWLPRRPKGGTYDEDWKQNVWPKWPKDYDFAFHNSAHPDLVIDGYLSAGVVVRHWGFSESKGVHEVQLPELELAVRLLREDGSVEDVVMNLDTFLLDIEDNRREKHRVFISWRIEFETIGLKGIAILGRQPKIFKESDVKIALQESQR